MTTNETTFKTIIEALKIEELPDEEQAEFLTELSDIVFRGTLTRINERMDDATREGFTALMETDPSDEDVEAFLAAHVPDADEAVEETIREITEDILASVKPS
jgi:hypothetical protein